MTKRAMSEQERLELDKRIKDVEEQTGAQIVLAVIERSDVYAELPWKAFALGTAVAGLAISLAAAVHARWPTAFGAQMSVPVMLATGATCALACVFLPRFARLFLETLRAEVEVRQYAESLFLSREVFNTRERTGIVMLVSLFEQQIVLVPDRGLRKRLSDAAAQGIIARMRTLLAMGRVAAAFGAGLDGLEAVLTPSAAHGSQGNELPDSIIEEKGP